VIIITWDETKTNKYPITPSNDNLTASDWNCLSDDTEILTNVGWVGVDDISTDLDALTYNFDTDELEWCPVTHVHIYDVTDIDMVHIHCRTQSQLVTPNHRVIHKNKYKNTWEMKDGCNVKKHSIMMASSQYNCDDNVYTDEMLKVIAWVITEGSYSVDSNNVTITQSHKKYSNHIADLLDSIGFEYNVHTRDGIDHFVLKSWCGAIIRSHLRHGKTKLTPELLNLNTRQARVFINELVMGDGTFRSSGNSFNYYSNDSSLIDGIQELCIKSGIRSIKSDAFTPPKGKKWYALYCTYTDCSYIRAHEPTIVKYTGRIWCISTANETFVARRQGRPFITGNSMVIDQKDRLSKTNDTLDDVPDGTTYVKSTNDYTDADKTKVDYITITTSVDLDSVSTKLDGIDSGATDDQTAVEIVTLINASGETIDSDNIANTLTGKTLNSSTNTIHADSIHAYGTNVSGSTITEGSAVYVSGYNIGTGYFEISLADSSSDTTMPCFGITATDISNNSSGMVIVNGIVSGIDTSSYSVGDELYVSSSGTLASTKPTGTDKIQKVAVVVRSNIATGAIVVFGAGRTNDVPNIAEGKVWVGNSSGVATETTLADVATTGAYSDLTGTPTITAAAQTVLDDTTIAAMRTTLDVDQSGTDNSTDVTLTGSNDYITITGQEITVGDVDLANDVTGTLNETNGGTGQTTLTTGDILYASASNTISKLAAGTEDHVLTMSSGVPVWEAAASGFSDPMTTRGDIIYKNSSGTTTRLAVGTADQVLTSDGTDISWADVSGGTSYILRTARFNGELSAADAYKTDVLPVNATLSQVKLTMELLPTGQSVKVQVTKNGAATTDSVFSADTPVEMTTSQSAETNGMYVVEGTLDSGMTSCSENDYFVVTVTQVGSTYAGSQADVQLLFEV
jgi:hypothetical protein